MKDAIPELGFDPAREAIIEPAKLIKYRDLPEHCVLCFFRDEGTSYHYLPAGREAYPSAEAVTAVTRVLDRHNMPYVTGKTWTTDAFYRETPKRVATRREQGCLTVEMEAAALFAVAEFRHAHIAQLLYGDDDVSGIEWDPRGFGRKSSARETLFWLSLEACLEIEDE